MSNGMSKGELVGALAAAMGQVNFQTTKYEESKYDPGTGTLYCQGYIISRGMVDEALNYFKTAKMKAEKFTDPTMRATTLYYQTAIEAIIMMQKSAISNGGKVIAKNA